MLGVQKHCTHIVNIVSEKNPLLKEVRRMAAIKDGEKIVGNRTKVKIVKNKVAAPFREVEVDILYGEGISREADLLDLGVLHELVEKSGSWFSYAGERIGQGRDNARAYLVANPEAREQLDAGLRKKLGFEPPSEADRAAKPAASAQLTLNKAAQSA